MSEARELDLPIPPEAARQRADRFVADRSGLSRSFVQRLISVGSPHDGRADRPG